MISDAPQESRRKSQFLFNDPLLEKVNLWREGGPRGLALGLSLLVNFLAYQQLQHVDISFAEANRFAGFLAAGSTNGFRQVPRTGVEPVSPE